MLKVLIVSASPRPYGACRSVAKLLLELSKQYENVEAEHIDVYDYTILPCVGCVSDNVKACRFPCPIDDDVPKLYEKVERSDIMIFVSPIYWYNVPGQLKNFIDRLTIFENAIFVEGRSRLEGKVVGFIAIGNDVGAIALIQNLMITFNSMGTAVPPWALAYHASEEDALENEKFLLDAANVLHCAILMARAIREGKPVSEWYRADPEFRKFVIELARKIREDVDRELHR